jgi:magnesium transporter
VEFSLIGYDPAGAWIKNAATAEELLSYKNPAGITWINVDGLEPSPDITRLAQAFRIHPLTVEDMLDTKQRPKAEEFDDYLFVVLKSVSPEPCEAACGEREIGFEQISLVITRDTVISFQEKPGDYFDGIRKRILNNAGRVRRMGTDYLAWMIMDAVVDEYFAVFDVLGAEIEEFEDRAMDQNDRDFIQDIQSIKRNLLRIRRVIWPLRESFAVLSRLESGLVSAEVEPFLKDLQDNILRAGETVETYRELIAGVMEVNLSAVSNRMNNIMKVLTIISTIFIPLTFIVGVYGMNFTHMPELQYPYAYPLIWGLMVLIALGMLVYFKRRHWL